jgi:hypothetical protein
MRYIIAFALGAMLGAGAMLAWAFVDDFERTLDPQQPASQPPA